MSHELPVITSDNTPWDIVKKNNYGWVISLNEDSIYSAVSTANSLPDHKLIDMGVRGKKYIKDNLSWDVLSNDYLTFYDWVQNGGEIPSFVDIF
jgi:glycosyltransferase involved in cell wall biosynthesis